MEEAEAIFEQQTNGLELAMDTNMIENDDLLSEELEEQRKILNSPNVRTSGKAGQEKEFTGDKKKKAEATFAEAEPTREQTKRRSKSSQTKPELSQRRPGQRSPDTGA
ncbi:unnamed protein product [Microthlaspi erraticum]|uniref:Uncharacterized protein n=1 Tax=Microthlaspi erraticum TaxID=1685480 RepID=A0A6D2LI21_9BRAS|nr:unnamed protein product [Microthlaspi erraticum]